VQLFASGYTQLSVSGYMHLSVGGHGLLLTIAALIHFRYRKLKTMLTASG
jgi:hypothetical protein